MAINLLNPGQGLAEEASYPDGAGLDGVIMPRVAILIETALFHFPFRFDIDISKQLIAGERNGSD